VNDLDAAKLRLQCLELAKASATASCSGLYTSGIISDATLYWEFIRGPIDNPTSITALMKSGVRVASPEDGDVIPF